MHQCAASEARPQAPGSAHSTHIVQPAVAGVQPNRPPPQAPCASIPANPCKIPSNPPQNPRKPLPALFPLPREKNKSKNRRSVSRSSTRAMSRSGTRAMSRAGTRQQSTRVGSSRGPGRLYSTLSTSQASASAASGSRAPSRSNSDLEKGEGSSAGKTIAESEKSL